MTGSSFLVSSLLLLGRILATATSGEVDLAVDEVSKSSLFNDDACGEDMSECSLHFRQLRGQYAQDPSMQYQDDFNNAEQAAEGLPDGGNINGVNVGGEIQQAEEDMNKAQQSQEEFNRLERQQQALYHHVDQEEAEWNKEEASWPSDASMQASINKDMEGVNTDTNNGVGNGGSMDDDYIDHNDDSFAGNPTNNDAVAPGMGLQQVEQFRGQYAQDPSMQYQDDFNNAEQAAEGLPDGGNINGVNVGGEIQQAEEDMNKAQQSQEEFNRLERQQQALYHHVDQEEAEWNKEEASWPSDASMQASINKDMEGVNTDTNSDDGNGGSMDDNYNDAGAPGMGLQQVDAGQDPAMQEEFQNAQQYASTLPNGGNINGVNVGQTIQQAENDLANAQKAEAQFNKLNKESQQLDREAEAMDAQYPTDGAMDSIGGADAMGGQGGGGGAAPTNAMPGTGGSMSNMDTISGGSTDGGNNDLDNYRSPY